MMGGRGLAESGGGVQAAGGWQGEPSRGKGEGEGPRGPAVQEQTQGRGLGGVLHLEGALQKTSKEKAISEYGVGPNQEALNDRLSLSLNLQGSNAG